MRDTNTWVTNNPKTNTETARLEAWETIKAPWTQDPDDYSNKLWLQFLR